MELSHHKMMQKYLIPDQNHNLNELLRWLNRYNKHQYSSDSTVTLHKLQFGP